MSHELIFDILPFDPLIVPNHEIRLPIDVDDLLIQLQKKVPNAETQIRKSEGVLEILVYIHTEQYGPRIVATYIEDHKLSQFNVNGWPKRIARELIFWYRHYVPLSYPLFLVIPSRGFVAELTIDTMLEDIDKMYPFAVSDD